MRSQALGIAVQHVAGLLGTVCPKARTTRGAVRALRAALRINPMPIVVTLALRQRFGGRHA